MSSRPDHIIYEDCLIHRHNGFPLWVADPLEGPPIQIGDLGYYHEGGFERVQSLPIQTICNGHNGIKRRPVRFEGPIYYKLRREVQVDVEGRVDIPGIGIPLGAGAQAGTTVSYYEGAVLRLESRSAVYTYLDRYSSGCLQRYALDEYRNWMLDPAFQGLEPHEIVLVLGTYMTKNWEARTCISRTTSVHAGSNIEVADVVGAQGNVDWSTWRRTDPGFSCGHLHDDTPVGNNEYEPFQDCCKDCSPAPETQCIFLRTGRIRERGKLMTELLSMGTAGEEKVVKRRWFWPRIGGTKSATPSNVDNINDNSQTNFLELQTSTLEDPSFCEALYDELARQKLKAHPEANAVLINDDDVILYLGGNLDTDAYGDEKMGNAPLTIEELEPADTRLTDLSLPSTIGQMIPTNTSVTAPSVMQPNLSHEYKMPPHYAERQQEVVPFVNDARDGYKSGGFFERAKNVDVRGGTYNMVDGDQINLYERKRSNDYTALPWGAPAKPLLPPHYTERQQEVGPSHTGNTKI